MSFYNGNKSNSIPEKSICKQLRAVHKLYESVYIFHIRII